MTSLPEFNPYDILGVAKDATVAEIKSAHRKLVLKCHPDKIKDESLRSQAQDQFQKVQQAYELLSDETSRIKYDQKVRLAELKHEMTARGSSYPRSHTTREYRDGRIYEERAPADDSSPTEAFFDDEHRYTEPPRPMSRKHDEYFARPRSRATEDKKKTKPPSSSAARAAKDMRDTTKTRSDRAKYRTKERRREASEKYTHLDSDTCDSESDMSDTVYVKRPSRNRESKHRSTESIRRSEEDDFPREYKHETQITDAYDYIRRSKETLDPERRHRPSRSPLRYDSAEPEMSSSRYSGRSKRSSREPVRPPTSHRGSVEHLEPNQGRVYEKIPPLPTAATFPGPKGSSSSPRPSHVSSRPSTGVRSQSRSQREASRRSEAVHLGMGIFPEGVSRTTKLRGEKPDSGYGSSSPTPEVITPAEPSARSTRYKTEIIEPSIQPPPLRHSRTYSPPRQERRAPVRSSTYAYPPAEPIREPSRRLYREVDSPHVKEKDAKHREVRDVHYIPSQYAQAYSNNEYHQPRRQSAY
ncbi:hypothetical protein AOCH_006167 [Aspergillus ochraceoroseus]|uniref:J domain-containing protein n=1 Tax=Aspergillus ochraceoroseus TaxID=138278 RepID=A0A0F8WXB7_9EURO|nr:hypothetical protein AOCH_006167 [Aspergillus ochraceoroseus]